MILFDYHNVDDIVISIITHRIHLWCKYANNLGYIDGKCCHISHTWILWVMIILNNTNDVESDLVTLILFVICIIIDIN